MPRRPQRSRGRVPPVDLPLPLLADRLRRLRQIPGAVLRSPPARRAALKRILLLAALVYLALGVASRDRESASLVDRWTAGTRVLVADGNLDRGEAITARDVTERMLPDPLVPSGALTDLPGGAVATATVVQGEVLVDERVGTEALDSAPRGTASIRLDPAVPAPAVETGDRVDVLSFVDTGAFAGTGASAATGAPGGPGSSGETGAGETGAIATPGAEVVARSAEVLVAPEGDDTSMTVAVAEADVLPTAAATLRSGVVVVLRGR